MKDPESATKLVLRHLPPTLSEAALRDRIDAHFTGRYNWLCFRPPNSSSLSHRHQLYSRAYIQLKTPQDVFEFADMFNGHIFVNEKGSQFKAVVEYAPYQCVPDTSKKDPRAGTIYKDPKYVEFLEMLSKPTENLPSAEIQLERKEAERAVAGKGDAIVTPLMEFVRQRRAAKSGPSRLATSNRRSGGRVRGANSPSSPSVIRRGSERSKMSNVAYVLRDSAKIASNKDKSTYVLASQREQQQCRENEILIEKNRRDAVEGKDRHISYDSTISLPSWTEMLEDEAGVSVKNIQDPTVMHNDGMTAVVDGAGEAGKKRLLLSKEREKELSNGPAIGLSSPNGIDTGVQLQRRHTSSVKGSASAPQTGGSLHQHGITSPGKGTPGSLTLKQNQRSESSGRIGRGMISTKDLQLPVTSSNTEQPNQLFLTSSEKDKRPPKHPGPRCGLKDHGSGLASPSSFADVNSKNFQDEKSTHTTERQDRRTRNKDRPDRPVWTPRRRSDGPSVSDASQPSSESLVSAKFQSGPEGLSKLEKIEKGSAFQQNVGFAEATVEDKSLQGDNVSDTSVTVKFRYPDLIGSQTARRSNATSGVIASWNNTSTNQADLKSETVMASGGVDFEIQGNGRMILATAENGNHRQLLRRPSAPTTREVDGALALGESKPAKRGGTVGYGSQEKQVWVAVQKSGS